MLERIQEDRQEWRAFNLEGTNRRSRTGMPTSLAHHDMGLATVSQLTPQISLKKQFEETIKHHVVRTL